MKYKIGIFGSAVNESPETIQKAKKLGQILGKNKLIVITGASVGMPYFVSSEAYKNGAKVWGYTPVLDIEGQKKFAPNCDLSIYEKLIYVPKSYEYSHDLFICQKYRNVSSTANCDAGIILSGRWGTMNEFTNLFDMCKIIGVLTGTGGVADELPALCKKISKPGRGKVVFSDSPEELVKLVMEELMINTDQKRINTDQCKSAFNLRKS